VRTSKLLLSDIGLFTGVSLDKSPGDSLLFKQSALRGVSYALTTQLRNWVKQLADDPQHAFPGHGQMKPEQLEIAQLKREVARLKAERDILKKAAAYFAKEST